MTSILAHHVEAYHVPVLLLLFAAGARIGWQMMSRFAAPKR